MMNKEAIQDKVAEGAKKTMSVLKASSVKGVASAKKVAGSLKEKFSALANKAKKS